MKPYRDLFGNPLTKQDVKAAVAIVVQHGKSSPSLLQRTFGWGYSKAIRITAVLEDAGVIGTQANNPYLVVLKKEDEAVNAALRQLKKGRK